MEQTLDRAAAFLAIGDFTSAEQTYRRIVEANPSCERGYAGLIQVAATRELSALSHASRAAQQRLASHFKTHQTDRFILFSDVTDEITQQNARWVERTYHEFKRFAEDCGLRPLPLQHKLVCILFERRRDYLEFAESQDGLNNIAFTGYYSPKHDRVVFSVESDRDHAGRGFRARAAANHGDHAKDIFGFEGDATTGLCEGCSDDQLPNQAAAKCVHETIHQLMFHTRIMAAEVQYPLWICEGLATAFETDLPAQPFGPDRDYAPRREAFEKLLRNDDLISLRELVTVTTLPPGRPHLTRAVYQQSYALVTWMSRERKSELRDYLNAMRLEPAGRLSSSRHLRLFEQSFGDVDALEREWLAFERSGQRQAQASAVR